MIERRWIFEKRWQAVKAMRLIKGEEMHITEGDEVTPERWVLHAEFCTPSAADRACDTLAAHFAWNEHK